MPDIPNVPGVPPLSSYSPNDVTLLMRDAVALPQPPFGQQWGIFLNGAPVLVANSVVTFDYRREWTVSNYPVEQGAFESYDKVQLPFDVRIRFSSGSSESDRQALLDGLDTVSNSLDLYDVVTPEKTYTSVNITHYDYRRTSTEGLGIIVADVWGVQVRVTATPAFSSTKEPAGASPVSGGMIGPQEPSITVGEFQ